MRLRHISLPRLRFRLSRLRPRLVTHVTVAALAATSVSALPATALASASRPGRAARPAHVAAGHPGPARRADRQMGLGPLWVNPAVPPGTGPVRNGTFVSFPISDRVTLQVNTGSGNVMVRTTDLTVPETGTSLTLGTSYNSLLLDSGTAIGSEGWGWRARAGIDVMLFPQDNGNVTFVGPDGVTGTFTPISGTSNYTSDGEFKATLTQGGNCGGWTLLEHDTGDDLCFDSGGTIDNSTDRNGNVTGFSYDANGAENQITYTPHGASNPTRTVNVSSSNGYITGYSESDSNGTTRTVGYNINSNGDLASLTQADGTTLHFGYDSWHNLTSIENGDNVTTTLDYEDGDRVTTVTQQRQGAATTRFSYTICTSPAGSFTPSQTLLATPNTDQSQDVSSVPHITYQVDCNSARVTKTTDQQNNSRSTTYTPFFDIASSSNAEPNSTTTNSYGANNGESLTGSQAPMGAAVGFAYGNQATTSNPTANFQASSSTDAQKNATAYTYDGAGNLAQAKDALAAYASVSYNSDGTPSTSTDPNNQSSNNHTGYAYTDGKHQLNQVTPPTANSLGARNLTYDGFGRVHTATDGAGNTATYTYDLADRVTAASYTGGSHTVSVTYKYDGAGNLTKRTDPSGTTTYGYNGTNQLTSRTPSTGGGGQSYGYDLDGNLTSLGDARGSTSYGYDTRDLMNAMTDATGTKWTFAYDGDGRRTQTTFNSAQSTYTKMTTSYDTSGRITRITAVEHGPLISTLFDTSYCYSPYVSGQSCPTSKSSTDTALVQYATNNLSGTTSQYTYDKDNRITQATNVGGKTYTYVYDADGNAKTFTTPSGSKSLTYNSGNQITSSGYGYDGAGNQTSDPANGALTYNDAGQMTQANPSSGAENFSYADSSQTEMLTAGSSTFTYGLNSQYGQPSVQSYTTQGATDYVDRDQTGTPLGYDRNGQEYAFVTDNLGSVVAIVDTNGGTDGSYTYDPYGNATPSSGTDNSNLIRYTGGIYDPASGYTKLGQRYYNPGIGRFTQQDTTDVLDSPANGNLYAYAADSPINYIDPTGQSAISDYLLLGGLLFGSAESGIVAGEAYSVAIGGEALAAGALAVGAATGILAVAFVGGLVACYFLC